MDKPPNFIEQVARGMPIPPTEPIQRLQPKFGRNDPCFCGSGKKYKKCCLLVERELDQLEKEKASKQEDQKELIHKVVDIGFENLTEAEQQDVIRQLSAEDNNE